MLNEKKAVVLLSGGLDSATVLAIAREEGYDCGALSFRYGQRHAIEIEAAQRVAQSFCVNDHRIIDIDLRQFGRSALTDAIAVPKNRDESDMKDGIPVTYVPARNMLFLSYAVAMAEAVEARHVFIGVNAIDYSGYPDCRPEFIQAFAAMAQLGTKAGVEGRPFQFHTPLIAWTKAQIIQKGTELGVDYALTLSCYDPDPQGLACGCCDSCFLRKNGFRQAGVPDPTPYRSDM